MPWRRSSATTCRPTSRAGRHQVRIAVHALEVVGRELTLGPDQPRPTGPACGPSASPETPPWPRASGPASLDDQPGLVAFLRADTRDRLLVANPRWLPPEDG